MGCFEGRSQKEVEEGLEDHYPRLLALTSRIEAVSTDRAPAYKNIVQKVFRMATPVFDRFHIIQNIRDHALHPPLRQALGNRKFTAAIDRLFRDVVEDDDKERLTYENKLVLLQILGYSEELMGQYRKIIVVRSSYKEGDSWELHRRKLWSLYNDLILINTKLLRDKHHLSKIKKPVRSSLSVRYREGLDEQKRAFLEGVLKNIAHWSHLGKAYEYVEKIRRWYDQPFPDVQTSRDALHELIEEGLGSKYKEIQNAAKRLSWNESEEYIA
ncbi:transposase [Pasteuria penetrans]|uniref:transposase n=1 Tax=Pasteuria penetrans TaxID=86005 RepID=UPI0011EC7B87